MPKPRPVSKDPVALAHHGLRLTGVVYIDQPCELGYHCPVCDYPLEVDGEFDERLSWSEYRGFIWCIVCNVDYPSALCLPGNASRAIDIFHMTVAEVIDRTRLAMWQEVEAMHMTRIEDQPHPEWCHVCEWLLATNPGAGGGR